MNSQPQEVEVALLIAADDAPDVASAIARATHLAGYELVAREDRKLHDVLFDTVSHALQNQGFALRTRLQNGSPLITLKGAALSGERGAVTRMELEIPWSLDGFLKVADELARAQIKLAQPETFDDVLPGVVLRGAGLVPIQDRQTRRRVRDVLKPQDKDGLAELAIDAVRYQFGSSEVELYEVEIEAKQNDIGDVLHACSLALQSEFDAMLRPWPYGKLATGAAIERLLGSGELPPLLVNSQLIGARAALLLEDRLRS